MFSMISCSDQENRDVNSLYGYRTPRRRRNTGKNAFVPYNPFEKAYSPRNTEIHYGSMSDIYEPDPNYPFLASSGFVSHVTPKKSKNAKKGKSSRKKRKKPSRRKKVQTSKEEIINYYQQTSSFHQQDDYWGVDFGNSTPQQNIDDKTCNEIGSEKQCKSSEKRKSSKVESVAINNSKYVEVGEEISESIQTNFELLTIKKKKRQRIDRKDEKIRKGLVSVVEVLKKFFCIRFEQIEYNEDRQGEFCALRM